MPSRVDWRMNSRRLIRLSARYCLSFGIQMFSRSDIFYSLPWVVIRVWCRSALPSGYNLSSFQLRWQTVLNRPLRHAVRQHFLAPGHVTGERLVDGGIERRALILSKLLLPDGVGTLCGIQAAGIAPL